MTWRDYPLPPYQLIHLIYIPQAQEKHIRINAICLQGSEVILHDLGPTGESGSGCATRSHGHEVLLNILSLDVSHIDDTQQVLKIRRNLIRRIKGAKFIIDSLLTNKKTDEQASSQNACYHGYWKQYIRQIWQLVVDLGFTKSINFGSFLKKSSIGHSRILYFATGCFFRIFFM